MQLMKFDSKEEAVKYTTNDIELFPFKINNKFILGMIYYILPKICDGDLFLMENGEILDRKEIEENYPEISLDYVL